MERGEGKGTQDRKERIRKGRNKGGKGKKERRKLEWVKKKGMSENEKKKREN
jgi:hypothetical protein